MRLFRMTDESSRQLSAEIRQYSDAPHPAHLDVDRRVSQAMARQVYDMRDSNGSPVADAISWTSSRMPHESLFAIFDRALVRARVMSIEPLQGP